MTQRVIVVNTRGPKGQKGAKGDSVQGDAGTDGQDGLSTLDHTSTVVDNNTGSYTTLYTENIAAATLENAGDSVELIVDMSISAITNQKYFYFGTNGAVAQTTLSEFEVPRNVVYINARMRLTRKSGSNITVRAHFNAKMYNENYVLVKEESFVDDRNVLDLDASINSVDLRAKASGSGDTISLTDAILIKYKA